MCKIRFDLPPPWVVIGVFTAIFLKLLVARYHVLFVACARAALMGSFIMVTLVARRCNPFKREILARYWHLLLVRGLFGGAVSACGVKSFFRPQWLIAGAR